MQDLHLQSPKDICIPPFFLVRMLKSMRHANRTNGLSEETYLEKRTSRQKERRTLGNKRSTRGSKERATNEAIRLPPGLENDGERLHSMSSSL
jgi:hypothetical protein